MAFKHSKQDIDDPAENDQTSADPDGRQDPEPGPVDLTTKLEHDEGHGEHWHEAAKGDVDVVVHERLLACIWLRRSNGRLTKEA